MVNYYLVSILLFVCCIETIIIILTKGKTIHYIYAAEEMLKCKGFCYTCKYILKTIIGKIYDIVPFYNLNNHGDRIKIAFYPMGGLGDYIVSACILEEILGLSDYIDVMIFADNDKFANAIYGSRDRVYLDGGNNYELLRHKYDCSIRVEHFIHVDNTNMTKINKIAPTLHTKIQHIIDNWEQWYINVPNQCWRERIHFERCRILGLDRWTELRMMGAFEVSKHKVTIPLNMEYAHVIEDLNLYQEEYITVNYGADTIRRGKTQTKLWELDKYSEFCGIIHSVLPNVKIVQLGIKGTPPIEGCDRYAFDKNLEEVKWILKNAKYHIDCEGGLVHMATQLATKCIVMFGPTPVHMYGYTNNLNVVSSKCNNCMGLHEEWACSCLKNTTECMDSITAEKVAGILIADYNDK